MREFAFNSIIATIIVLFLLAFFLLGCAGPRSSVYCLKNGDWVTCPKGVKAGTDLGSK